MNAVCCTHSEHHYGTAETNNIPRAAWLNGSVNGAGSTLSALNGATPLTTTTTYGHDNASRLLTVNDGNNNVTTYSYLANSPLVGQITFTHSGSPRMTTTKQYDYLNRLTQNPMIIKPQCPYCNSRNVKFVKTPKNYFLTCLAVVIAFFSVDIMPTWWECASCSEQFRSTSGKGVNP